MLQENHTTSPKRRGSLLRRILIGILTMILLVVILAFVIPLTETESDRITENSGNWMSAVAGDLHLNEIVIPGTHDSATQYVQLAFFSKCQALDIGQQLEAGFRYLDIRLGFSGDALALMHGFAKCKTGPMPWSETLTLDAVLEDCYAFLEDNPSETIIFAVKQEHGSEPVAQLQETLLEQYIAPQADFWLLTDRIPTLDQARGKLVLMRRYEDEAELGEQAGIPMIWADQGSRDDTSLHTEMTDNGSYRLWVQDRYSYDNDEKWEVFLAGLGEAAIAPEDTAIHFLSTKGSMTYGHPYGHAGNLNRRLMEVSPKYLKGWIVVDFGSASLAEQIYTAN